MKVSLIVCLACLAAPRFAQASSPLSAAVSLMDDLIGKLETEAVVAASAAKEYAAWCKEKSTDLGFNIETGETSKEELEATIGKMAANIEATTSKIDELAATISQDDTELKEAEAVRAKEKGTFTTSEAELVDSIEVLSRAGTILEREMSKNPAALLQVDTSSVQAMIKSLSVVLDAAAFPSSGQKKLVALVQAQSETDADDEALDAPAAAVYKTHSTSILDVIEDLKEKAEVQLSDLRKAEQTATHSFEMVKQSLTDSIEADNKRLSESKASKASFAESKATAEGDLAVTVNSLEEDKEGKVTVEEKCAAVAADHEASMKGRSEELAAIAEAKKVLSETSAGAVGQTYSFVQVASNSKAGNHAMLANMEIVNLVKKLAKQQHSAALAQLASRISTVFRYGVQAGEDPFSKVKGLVSDLIAKLESEASEEASEKAFCDEEISKTDAKKSELNSDLESLTSKIDAATAKSTKLKGEVKEFQAELAAMAKVQAEATSVRQETKADYVTAKADLELGISGVRKAIKVLRAYFEGGGAVSAVASMPGVSKGSDGAFTDCPCEPTEDLNLEYKGWTAPGNYGSFCQAWDTNVNPDCKVSDPPLFCSRKWCYVGAACERKDAPSVHFGGMAFSYRTCGNEDYYTKGAPKAPVSYSKSTGSGGSITEILEVLESDFAKTLVKEETEEADAAAAYEKDMEEYKLAKATKEQDIKYKEKEYKSLDKNVFDISEDKDTTSTELASVLEYDAKLKERCVAKPETYDSRKARREAEIAGLKEALKILETETAFIQKTKRGHRRTFLGAL